MSLLVLTPSNHMTGHQAEAIDLEQFNQYESQLLQGLPKEVPHTLWSKGLHVGKR